MSDTPISDSTPHNVAELGVLCRKLERELNVANERIKNLESALSTVENINKVNTYQDLESANERIKRLEEVGDKLEYASVISESGEDPNGFEKLLIAQREWRKAKEDKP